MRPLLILCIALMATPLIAQEHKGSLLIEINGHRTVLYALAGFPHDTVTATFHDAPPHPYSGVSLRALLESAGLVKGKLRGPALAQYMVVEARDGYRLSFGVADLDAELVGSRLLLVDSLDGKALPANEGPWRLIVAGDPKGARSVRNVSSIVVREP